MTLTKNGDRDLLAHRLKDAIRRGHTAVAALGVQVHGKERHQCIFEFALISACFPALILILDQQSDARHRRLMMDGRRWLRVN